MEHPITISWSREELAATIHYPDSGSQRDSGSTKWPVIIICHGFVGSRIGAERLFVKAAREFSAQGYMVLRFDYAGCGESTGDYGRGTMEDLVEQTRRVIDYSLSIDCVDPHNVILLGHSLGGAVAILTAARDSRVRTLALWSSVANPFNDILKIVGIHVYEASVREGQADYLGYTFTGGFFESLANHHPLQEVRKFSGDVLLVHGTADEIIPVDYSYLYQKLFWVRNEGQCDKEIIFQADHTYSSGASTRQVIEKTTEWLNEVNKRGREWNDWTI